jgi:hypothetical protein
LSVQAKYTPVWLFGSIDSKNIRDMNISFYADRLLLLCVFPFKIEIYPQGVFVIVDSEYKGVLTEEIIAGNFYVKSIQPSGS